MFYYVNVYKKKSYNVAAKTSLFQFTDVSRWHVLSIVKTTLI